MIYATLEVFAKVARTSWPLIRTGVGNSREDMRVTRIKIIAAQESLLEIGRSALVECLKTLLLVATHAR